jgi:hypothetical protein
MCCVVAQGLLPPTMMARPKMLLASVALVALVMASGLTGASAYGPYSSHRKLGGSKGGGE